MKKFEKYLNEIRDDAAEALFGNIYPISKNERKEILEFLKTRFSEKAASFSHKNPEKYWSEKEILDNFFALWLWKYDSTSDIISHWRLIHPSFESEDEYLKDPLEKYKDLKNKYKNHQHIEEKYKQYKSDFLIMKSLQEVAVRGGRSSIGVLAWSGQPVIVDDTSADPRASVSLEDTLIMDFSWVGIPISDGDNVRLAVSFFLPYRNAWRNKRIVVERLRTVVERNKNMLLRYLEEAILSEQVNNLIGNIDNLTAKESSILKVMKHSTVIKAPITFLMRKTEEDTYAVPSSNHILLDFDEAENIILRELEWHSFLRQCSDWTSCKYPSAKKSGCLLPAVVRQTDENDIYVIEKNVKTIYGNNIYQLRFCFTHNGYEQNMAETFVEKTANSFESILCPELYIKTEDLSLRKRIGSIRTTLVNTMIDILFGILVNNNKVEQRINLCTQIMVLQTPYFKKQHDRDLWSKGVDKILSKKNRLMKDMYELHNNYHKLINKILLCVEYWEKVESDSKKQVTLVSKSGNSVRCLGEVAQNNTGKEPDHDCERYLKHPGTLSTLWRITDTLQDETNKAIKSATETAQLYPPLYNLLRSMKLEIEKSELKLKSPDKNFEIKISLSKQASENSNPLFTPQIVRLNRIPFIEKLWKLNYQKKVVDTRKNRENLNIWKLTPEFLNTLSPIWEKYDKGVAARLSNRTYLFFLGLELNQSRKKALEVYIQELSKSYVARVTQHTSALQSSVAAIMSRNLSHLLGSHIEPGIQNDMASFLINIDKVWETDLSEQIRDDLSTQDAFNLAYDTVLNEQILSPHLVTLYSAGQKALNRYSTYRQRRMDFVARMATQWPQWEIGYELHKFMILPFIQNSILLHFAGYSDGFTISDIDFTVEVNNQENYTLLDGNDRLGKRTSPLNYTRILAEEDVAKLEENNYYPLLVACRGGDIGVQAFHVILENVLRNSIKHSGKSLENDKSFTIGIFVFDNKDLLNKRWECSNNRMPDKNDCLYVVISSSADKPEIDEEMEIRLCNPIINKEGATDANAWGIKEMKISAAFLGGREIIACDSTAPTYIQAGKFKWDTKTDSETHLSYCIRLPKFKFADILSCNYSEKIQSSFNSLMNLHTEFRENSFSPFYQVISMSKFPEDILKNEKDADIKRNSLPARIILPKNNSDDLSETNIPICRLSEDMNLEIKPPDSKDIEKNNAEEYVLRLYDWWLNKLIQRREKEKISLSIFLQNNDKATCWNQFLEKNKPDWIERFTFPTAKPIIEDPEEFADVNLWRHIHYSEVKDIYKKHPPLFYQFTSFHNTFFSFFYSLNPYKNPFLAGYVLRQLIEAALIRVLVIDDRIARTLWRRQTRTENEAAELSAMGIDVAWGIEGYGEKAKFIKEAEHNKKGLVSIELDNEGNKISGNDYDLVFIHQTIFEDKITHLENKNREWKENWVHNLKQSIPYVVFHSGRGKQIETLPRNAQFLEFSVLQRHVLYEPSKFLLVLLGLGTKEKTHD